MDFTNIYEKKNAYAKYMVKEITYIIKKFEKRAPGSKGEEQACEYMADVLKKLGCEAKVESFKENPRSFYGWIYITITCALLAVAGVFVGKALDGGVLAENRHDVAHAGVDAGNVQHTHIHANAADGGGKMAVDQK